MVHGDDKGLRLPPAVAPYEVVVVPIGKSEDEIAQAADYLKSDIKTLEKMNRRIHVDDRLQVSPGFKFNEWEMKGAPVRLEVGARDIEAGQAVAVRRDTGEKLEVSKENIVSEVNRLLDEIQVSLYQQAKDFQRVNTHTVKNYSDFKEIMSSTGGFIRCGWDGNPETEEAIKDETNATIRCIPFDEQPDGLKCVYSAKPAKYEVIFAKAY